MRLLPQLAYDDKEPEPLESTTQTAANDNGTMQRAS